MIKPFLYIIFLFSFASTAQNLVPNGSFEEYTQCPTQNELGNGQFERCKDWYYTTPVNVGTPDYFNSCNNNSGGMVGVPSNFWGYQDAFHGSGYVGIDVFDYQISTQQYVGAEQIETKLKSVLSPCQIYHFSMRVSLANKATHGINKLGVLLTDSSNYQNSISDWISIEPTWENQSSLVDTTSWILVETDIIAHGGEQFLKIGYFADFDINELVYNDSTIINTFGTYSPYYYIDSVCLRRVGEAQNCLPEISNVFTPNGDQINDVYSIENLNISELILVNRWGNIITVLTDKQPFWDGTFDGKPCSEGSYFYRAKFGDTYLTGFIELIR